MPFVVDASVSLCWFVPGQESPVSAAILEAAFLQSIVVPPLWHIEIANQLGLKLRAGRLEEETLRTASKMIKDLKISTDPFPPHDFAPVVLLMNRFRLTAYDAVYLELAMRLQLPLATFDAELKAAALVAEVQLVR